MNNNLLFTPVQATGLNPVTHLAGLGLVAVFSCRDESRFPPSRIGGAQCG